MTLDQKIRHIRTFLRMSQREFASFLGCSQSIVSAYEMGLRKPSYDVLVKLDNVAKKNKIRVNLL